MSPDAPRAILTVDKGRIRGLTVDKGRIINVD